MLAPEFRNVSEVKQFINTSNDAWCLPMVEEYMNMCGVSLKDMERDVAYVEELNGWIQNELKDFTTPFKRKLLKISSASSRACFLSIACVLLIASGKIL